jgi:hypothetical protein
MPGEHDERARRIETRGRRQQQGDRQRRSDPRQDANGGAERHADKTPHQILERERDGEARHQRAERVHR